MKIKQTVKTFFAVLILAVGFIAITTPSSVFAVDSTNAAATTNNGCETNTAIIKCSNVDTTKNGVDSTGLWSLLLTAINILTAGVGIAAIGGIVYGAILYTSAGGSQEQVKKAMTVITNVVIGVIAYALMFSLLNYLIPGGLFH